jgi:hypothetical protein
MQRLYEILVPRTKDKTPIPDSHHHIWDEFVRSMPGGLTIMKSAKGQWVDPTNGTLFKEPMIPVRVYCRPEQIESIANFTARHYEQKAVMYYVISTEVTIKSYD